MVQEKHNSLRETDVSFSNKHQVGLAHPSFLCTRGPSGQRMGQDWFFACLSFLWCQLDRSIHHLHIELQFSGWERAYANTPSRITQLVSLVFIDGGHTVARYDAHSVVHDY